ncbi:23S rRNA (pseudouridine(1915)-N(3))-methyltransferase RlmH [Afifella sp. IM 167]|uniref:23S rRNA (pseudouridine(1915)-N(3))-methyltransferase RlmH n=1 Tax=Afifella sp. IM 167 TaxID=2033586 RepID=UPI001CCF6314|nr:23S rRNA (pseudouridine(1915)-N(3))-methyltransferase RlmH [Afifella sp. IM 167]MBZ8131939.1 23S rRNA (pseudouridine(1915)-N(3))-methyltransferase RlmH [Afifella sp. IM 167]
MRLLILAVGRMKSGPEAELAARYLDRVRKAGKSVGMAGVEVRELAESGAARSADRKAEEAEALKKHIGSSPFVALDESGKNLNSEDFAAIVGGRADAGEASLAFVIGGPDGLDPAFRDQAAATIAFGKMTWPHKMARLMLAEQLYRAVTILSGHPYHRA